jgi:hypothetical protein
MGLHGKSVLEAVSTNEANHWKPATRVNVLVIVEDLKSWERGGD